MTEGPPTPMRDSPWVMRTYAGHSTPEVSNRLFCDNLARGQTGLSIAFDLPTQTGHDPDHALAAGEVGKVGVPVSHLGDMERLLDGLPLERMNTSMTINATAPWLLALYVALADRQGADRTALAGTVQNDIVKEYLSRGTYIFPPEPSLRLATDIIAFTGAEMPRWNPINICSYHLKEAGATPVQELAFALANATAVLDTVHARTDIPEERFATLVGRVSFFVNAGLRLVTEISKLRAFTRLWDEICRERYGIEDPKLRRFRYGVQVNSLGLTEQQPENNVYRILIEMLAVVLSKDARARAVQLPAWNEALGLPRPWDQQWSLRAQQIVAYETDILEHADIFAGSSVVEANTKALMVEAREEMAALGDVAGAVESGTMKAALVASNARRLAAIESGAQTVVGVNAYAESAKSPLAGAGATQEIDPQAEAQQVARLRAWREARDDGAAQAALAELESVVRQDRNVMKPSIACALAGVTTGEWADTLRRVFGEYRAPTGVGAERVASTNSEAARRTVAAATKRLGRPPRLLVAKPGLDGHSNGAEQIALRARDCGFEVIYEGIRRTPAEIVKTALEEDVDLIGLSVLTGGHSALATALLEGLSEAGVDDVQVVIGGIVPPDDAKALRTAGIARVFTPKDYDLGAIVGELARLVA